MQQPETLRTREGGAMQQTIEELEKAQEHLDKARDLLPDGKPYDQDHYRGLLLYEASDKIRYVLGLLQRDPRGTDEEKEE